MHLLAERKKYKVEPKPKKKDDRNSSFVFFFDALGSVLIELKPVCRVATTKYHEVPSQMQMQIQIQILQGIRGIDSL